YRKMELRKKSGQEERGQLNLRSRYIYVSDIRLFLLRFLSKYVNRSDFDHVAVVIRDCEDNYPYIYQTLPGQTPTLTPYDECIIRSSAREIVIKRLQYTPTEDQLHRVTSLIESRILTSSPSQNPTSNPVGQKRDASGEGWGGAMKRLMWGLVTSPGSLSRVTLVGRIQNLEKRVEELAKDVKKWEDLKTEDDDSDEWKKKEFMRRKRLKKLVAEYRVSRDEIVKKKTELKELQNPDSRLRQWRVEQLLKQKSVFPAAQGVAEVLIELGVLPGGSVTLKEFTPRHFLRPEHMPLQNGAEYLPDVYLRSSNKGARRSSYN
ncbi:hypothetical protein AAMO2058_001758000, partial [Amorphochlora amoebiformis]